MSLASEAHRSALLPSRILDRMGTPQGVEGPGRSGPGFEPIHWNNRSKERNGSGGVTRGPVQLVRRRRALQSHKHLPASPIVLQVGGTAPTAAGGGGGASWAWPCKLHTF